MAHPWRDHTYETREAIRINSKERQHIGMVKLLPQKCFLTQFLAVGAPSAMTEHQNMLEKTAYLANLMQVATVVEDPDTLQCHRAAFV